MSDFPQANTAAAATTEDLVFPASFAQQRLWFLHQLLPDSPAYNVALARLLKGQLDKNALTLSIDELVSRHETLRTRFDTVDDEPVQVVLASRHIPVVFAELADTSPSTLQEIINRLSRQTFNLSEDSLLRAHIFTKDDAHLFVLTLHHIIADAWSLDILFGELVQLYNGHCLGQPVMLPELPIQYGDYADWQTEQIHSAQQQQQLNYWRSQLVNAPELLDLPTDRPRPSLQSYAGDTLYTELPTSLITQLKQLAQQSGSTLFVVVLAAYAVLLGRYASSKEVVIGTPMSGRDRQEVAGVIGIFLNTLALRLDLDNLQSFRDLIEHARSVSFDAYANPDVPFEKLVDELQPGRNMSYAPIFQTMLVMHQIDESEYTPMQGIEAQAIPFETHTAKFDLTLFVTESNTDASAVLEYNTDLFNTGTIERMLDHFVTVLTTVALDPDVAIDEISLLDSAERHRVVEEFNSTDTDFDSQVTVADLFAKQVARTPDATALSSTGESISYRELERRANVLAAALLEHGAGAGHRIAICCPRDPVLPIAALACVKAGACYVPVDPGYPSERIEAMLADAQPTVILGHSSVALPAHSARLITLDDFSFSGNPEPGTTPAASDAIYCIYTSGSTGKPKGVQLSQAGLANLLQWQGRHERLHKPARTVQFTSFSFDVSFQEVFSTWCHGGELVMLTDTQRQDFALLAAFIAEHEIERIFLPFAALQPLAETWDANPVDLALADVIVAGEQLKITPAVRSLFERCAGAALHNQYGPSETHVVTALTLSGDPQSWPVLPSIGTPVANTHCYVLDAQLQPLPIGLPGELYLGGAQVALGYLNRPELDAEKFIPSPFIAGERLYRTGDRVRFLTNGELEFLGRVDDQFKWRGFRIEPGEIETALTADESVEDAVVVIRDDTGDQRLVAYVAPVVGKQPDRVKLAQSLKQSLPEHMQPSIIVILDALPLTPSGKVARRALPVPDYSRIQTAPYVAPRTPAEEAMVALFRQVLKLERISIHDDFFQLGGHSLLATQLIARVRATLNVEASLLDLFANPTLAAFSDRVDELRGITEPPALVVKERPDILPLSFSQQRLWFLDQLEPGNPVYNFPIVLRLRGQLDRAALENAINALVDRHESLRTSFTTVSNQPTQVISAVAPVTLEVNDLSGGTAQQRDAILNDLIQTGFDLTVAPLLHVHLLRSSEHEHTLILITHHIVSDGWSLGVLLNELSSLYTAFANHKEVQLNALPIQYADYALWQHEWFTGDELDRQMAYWRNQLEDAPTALDIPTDWPRPAEQSFNGRGELRGLSLSLQTSLLELARSHGSTLYMVLLAVFNILLGRYAATDDVVVGTPIAGRRMQETEGLIGFFANTLALRTDLSGDPRFVELLARVRETTLGAQSNQDLPFEKLVEELQPERNLSHSPIFQVMLVLQNNPDEPIRFGELEYEYPEFEMGISKFDLLLDIAEEQIGLRTGIQYNTDIFSAATIKRMLARFESLLVAVCENPNAKLSELPLINAQERDRIVNTFNDSSANFGPDICVHQLVEAQAVQTPDAIALSFGETSLSYQELNQQADALARHLTDRGARPGEIVAIASKRCIELPIAVLAVLKSGACYTPVDPSYPAERVQIMLEDSAARIVISQSDIELPTVPHEIVMLDRFDFSNQCEPVSAEVSPADPLYCIYTSGSTGKPKGVQLAHAGLANLLRWQMQHERLSQPAKTLQFASLSFDVSFQEIFGTWSSGGELVMVSDNLRQDLTALAAHIDKQNIERLYLPFAAFQPVATELASADHSPALRDVIVAGEQLQVTDIVRTLFAKLPNAALHNQYGPSETHVVTATTLTGAAQDWPGLPSIGTPVANTQCYILDPQQNVLPIGLPGELYLGGKQLAIGYLNRPDQDLEKFVNSPFNLGQRLYRTGDRARWLANGEIEFLGRVDEQIKWRGFRVEPGEIETALTSLDTVNNAIVVLREDQPGDKRLVAYVTPAAGTTGEAQDIQQQLKQLLPQFMQPAPIVVLDKLPLTPSGKVARRLLPVPDYGRTGDLPLVEPRNSMEAGLVELWKSVLGLAEVSIHDDFFTLGGHSLLATQLIARVRDQFGVALPLKYIFRYPSPASLGETITALQATSRANASDADDQDYEEISI